MSVILFLVVITATTIGQPQLDLTRTVVTWPTVELHFKVSCDGTPVYDMHEQDFHIHENGWGVPDFTLWCPEQSGDDCVITFQSGCADGSIRKIELSMPQFCGGSVSDTLSYRAPLDSSAFWPLNMTIPALETMSGDTVAVPLLLPWFPGRFPRFSATLRFDARCLEFLSVEAPYGTYLENVPIDAQRIAGGVRLETLEDLGEGLYPFSGVLCLLQFRTLSVQSKTVCAISGSDAAFASGCLLPDIEAGELTIYPATTEPVLLCQISADTISVDEVTDTYYPMPFTLRCDVRNVGSITTAPVYATLSIQPDLAYDSAGVSGESTLQLSRSTMDPLERASASWQLWHPVSRTERRYTVTVTLHSANTDSLSSTKEVVIPPVDLNPFSFDIAVEGAAYATEWKAVVCEGDSVTLDAGGGYASYLWSTGARTRRIVVSSAGQYSCDVTDSTGLSGESNNVVVEVEPPAHTTISIWGSLPLCSNDSLILSIGPGWPGSRWNTGDTTYRTTVRAPGLYYATIVGRYGCPGYTDTIEVTTIPAPVKPVITRSVDELTSTEAHGYQWQRNGGNIPGATQRTYRMTASGTYRVEVFAENGCSTFSDPFEVQVLGIAPRPSTTAFSLQSWPDPARDKLTISLTGPSHESIRLLLSDVLGRTMLLFDGQLVNGRRQLSHEITGYAPGPLLLLLLTSEGVKIKKVLKE
ncbi:MAG: hypothetical protein RRA94_08425 [Bacteroidota bacterium]|nr:hypothetical protein [Bacteroidota bacterium]